MALLSPSGLRRAWLLAPLLAPLACSGGKDAPTDSPGDTAENDTDTDADTDSDTDSDSDTDTDSDTDSDTDTDTGTTETFTAYTASVDLVEATDVAATADGVYVVGFDAAGDATVNRIDPSTGALSTLYSGEPLVQPSGIAVSEDGGTLYIADLAVPAPGLPMNGAVYALPAGGGALLELGANGVIDLPGDIAVVHGGGALYVSGYTAAGAPAIFTLSEAGAVNTVYSGAPLVDPLALATDPDGAALYVVDSLAADGRAELLKFSLPDFRDTTLSSGFQVAFPAGLGGSADGGLLYYSTVGDPGLVEISTDGASLSVVDTLGLLELPAGVSAVDGRVYVTELSRAGDADLYLLSY